MQMQDKIELSNFLAQLATTTSQMGVPIRSDFVMVGNPHSQQSRQVSKVPDFSLTYGLGNKLMEERFTLDLRH